MIITKLCSICGKELPISAFWKKKSTKNGYYSMCIDCYKTRYYTQKKNTLYKKQHRIENKVEYTGWGGIKIRDEDCTKCSKYGNACKVHFESAGIQIAQTCKHFIYGTNIAKDYKTTTKS